MNIVRKQDNTQTFTEIFQCPKIVIYAYLKKQKCNIIMFNIFFWSTAGRKDKYQMGRL